MKDGSAVDRRSEDTIEHDGVKVWIEPQVGARPLHDADSAASTVDNAAVPHPAAVEAEHGVYENATHCAEQPPVVRETRAEEQSSD
jgi:hypothetical protein